MDFILKKFGDLSASELYNIYFLRSEVFVVEQNCVYQDPDEKDLVAFHVMMVAGDQLAGYARILPPGVSYKEPSIGRVVVKQKFRHAAAGQLLMKYNITQTLHLFHNQDIVISAQLYLLAFYTSLGFSKEGEEYAEDNIPHIKMRYKIACDC